MKSAERTRTVAGRFVGVASVFTTDLNHWRRRRKFVAWLHLEVINFNNRRSCSLPLAMALVETSRVVLEWTSECILSNIFTSTDAFVIDSLPK